MSIEHGDVGVVVVPTRDGARLGQPPGRAHKPGTSNARRRRIPEVGSASRLPVGRRGRRSRARDVPPRHAEPRHPTPENGPSVVRLLPRPRTRREQPASTSGQGRRSRRCDAPKSARSLPLVAGAPRLEGMSSIDAVWPRIVQRAGRRDSRDVTGSGVHLPSVPASTGECLAMGVERSTARFRGTNLSS